MSLWAIAIGIALGVVILICALRQRVTRASTFLLLTLAVIALFYPAFELFNAPHSHTGNIEGFSASGPFTAHIHVTVHLIIVATLLAVSFWAVAQSPSQMAFTILAALILGHGLFYVIIFIFIPLSNAGPVWWPEFCAAVDITLGLGLLSFRKRDLV